jgi:hypothetical protein
LGFVCLGWYILKERSELESECLILWNSINSNFESPRSSRESLSGGALRLGRPIDCCSGCSVWFQRCHHLAPSRLLPAGAELDAALAYLDSFGVFGRCSVHIKWTQPNFKEKTLKDDIKNHFWTSLKSRLNFFHCPQFDTKNQVSEPYMAGTLIGSPAEVKRWSTYFLVVLTVHFILKHFIVKNACYYAKKELPFAQRSLFSRPIRPTGDL